MNGLHLVPVDGHELGSCGLMHINERDVDKTARQYVFLRLSVLCLCRTTI